MRSFTFPATLTPNGDRTLTVKLRDLPEAITSGRGRPEALAQASDCLEEAFAGRITDGPGDTGSNQSPPERSLGPLAAGDGFQGGAVSGDS